MSDILAGIVEDEREEEEKYSQSVESPIYHVTGDVPDISELCDWSQIAIDERGNVMYCCHKPFQTVGNILDSDILERLHAAPYVASTCDVPCRLSGPNHFMREVQRERKDVAFI